MRRMLCATAAALAVLAPAPLALAQAQPATAAMADSLFHATTLDLAAYGEVKVQPDVATITLGVMTEGPTAAAAMAANAQQMARVVGSLKAGGIAPKDIQTANLNLSPKYAYGQNQPPKLTGYQASNDVRVTVRDLARLGAAVDATVSAGANQVNGISFGLSDRTVAEAQARELAVRTLNAKAEQYARATGLRLARLISISEGVSVSGPRPLPVPMARMTAAAASTPIEAGELDVRIDVTGVFELAR